MAIDYRNKSIETLTPEQREEAIIQHEMRRLEIVKELEGIMDEYAKLMGKPKLKRRGASVGKAVNDWRK